MAMTQNMRTEEEEEEEEAEMGREGGLNEPDARVLDVTHTVGQKKDIYGPCDVGKVTYVQYVPCQRGGCKEEFRPRVAFFPPPGLECKKRRLKLLKHKYFSFCRNWAKKSLGNSVLSTDFS